MLPVLLIHVEHMYHQLSMISALDSIIKHFSSSSSSSSSLLINHINDCTSQKIIRPGVLFLILHFTIIRALLATLFHPFYLHGPFVLPVCDDLFTCAIVQMFLKYVLFNLCNKFFSAEHKKCFN
jgi:hypothetical protein